MDKIKIALLSLICALLIWQTASLHRKWEYRVEYIPDATYNTVLEKLGQERWEIISARRATTSSVLSSAIARILRSIFEEVKSEDIEDSTAEGCGLTALYLTTM